jgi:hypothetical protein
LLSAKETLVTALNTSNQDGLKDAKSRFEALRGKTNHDWLVDYYIAYTNYRLAIIAQWTTRNPEEVNKYTDEAVLGLKESIKKNAEFSDAHALLAAVYGQKLGIDPSLGATLAYEAQVAIERARELSPKSPKAAVIAATFTYYTPEEYGGSKSWGIDQMKEAVELFKVEDTSDPTLLYWGREEALCMLGSMCLENGRLEEAKASVEQALATLPGLPFATMLKTEIEKQVAAK